MSTNFRHDNPNDFDLFDIFSKSKRSMYHHVLETHDELGMTNVHVILFSLCLVVSPTL